MHHKEISMKKIPTLHNLYRDDHTLKNSMDFLLSDMRTELEGTNQRLNEINESLKELREGIKKQRLLREKS